ncbi:hypothetical protein GTO10_05725 [Candidatus Saccharibacteria bacterium]|nr:hypothetical protein [Candidatus Saccharibacteria bacterium]
MKVKFILSFLFLVAVLILGGRFLLVGKGDSELRTPPQALLVRIGETVIEAEVFSTDEERTQGLSARENLLPDKGALFVFESLGIYPFWMKDMLFPVDIIWINADHVVVDIEEDISPSSFPQKFAPSQEVLYAIEVNAGFVTQNGIVQGDLVKFTGAVD